MAKKSSASSRREKLVRVRADRILGKPLNNRQRAMLERLGTVPDAQIDYSDIQELSDEQLASAVPGLEFFKTTPISLRVPNDVLAWVKSKGPGHLTRINAILRNVMEAERRVKKSA